MLWNWGDICYCVASKGGPERVCVFDSKLCFDVLSTMFWIRFFGRMFWRKKCLCQFCSYNSYIRDYGSTYQREKRETRRAIGPYTSHTQTPLDKKNIICILKKKHPLKKSNHSQERVFTSFNFFFSTSDTYNTHGHTYNKSDLEKRAKRQPTFTTNTNNHIICSYRPVLSEYWQHRLILAAYRQLLQSVDIGSIG